MKLLVLTPHFAPDVAPTGEVVTRIVEELARRGHGIDVVTALPWYREHRVEPGFGGRIVRREDMPWGTITRLHPFPTSDKRNIARRALSYAGFTALAAVVGSRGAPLDVVLAVSPPLSLGVAGSRIARARGARFVFNVQDVFPDVAVALGALRNRALVAAAARVERACYRRADAVTVLSEDVRGNVAGKLEGAAARVHVIPNFVDTEAIRPSPRDNSYRREFGLIGKTVVMYAGNVGLSQPLDIVIDAAQALAYDPDLVFVVNGQGARRRDLEQRASGLGNVRFVDLQPAERLPEVLGAADLHLVPLRRGLARSSVPSKTYSIMAAGRPFVGSVDPGSEIARLVERSGAGVVVPPEDPEELSKAIRRLVDAPDELQRMGRAARSFIEGWASPAAVAKSYESLFATISASER